MISIYSKHILNLRVHKDTLENSYLLIAFCLEEGQEFNTEIHSPKHL